MMYYLYYYPVSSTSVPHPRFTVDERGHRLPGISPSPIKSRMTTPVRRQSLQLSKTYEAPAVNDTNSDIPQFENPKTQSYIPSVLSTIVLFSSIKELWILTWYVCLRQKSLITVRTLLGI